MSGTPRPRALPAGAVGAPWVAGRGVRALVQAWLRRASVLLGDSAPAIDSLNVFPVPDADTGSNVSLTLDGITRAVPRVGEAGLDEVARAAVVAAHGSSGSIVAEMVSSACRRIEAEGVDGWPARPGTRTALLLRTVADAGSRAVAEPVHGTILTVAADAARAAEQRAGQAPDDALAVAVAAREEAARALRRTPQQLPALGSAGVVDAGGQAYALLLDALVEVLGGPAATALPEPAIRTGCPAAVGSAGFEVMYLLSGVDAAGLEALRGRLRDLGHDVVVAGSEPARVHVHLADPEAAVAVGRAHGQVNRLRVTPLPPVAAQRTVLVALAVLDAHGLGHPATTALDRPPRPVAPEPALPTLAGLLCAAGVRAVPAADLDEVLAAVPGEVLLVTDLDHDDPAEPRDRSRPHLRDHRRPGLAVVPVDRALQALAALAVHEPSTTLAEAAAAMTAAAQQVRCEVAGSDDPLDRLLERARRLLGEDGELLTVLLPLGAEPLGARLAARLAEERLAEHRGVEVHLVVLDRPGDLLLGAE